MIRLAKYLLKHLWLALVGLVLLLGLLFGAMRLLLPHADGLRAALERQASATLGHPVEIGWLTAELRGFGPELVLHNLRINDAAGARLLGVEMLGLDVGLWDSFRARALTPSRIRMEGARIQISRDPDGALRISGLEALHRPQGGSADGDRLWVAPPRRVLLRDSFAVVHDRLKPEAKLHRLSVGRASFLSDGQRHQLDADLRLESGFVSLAADIRGPLTLPAQWSGELYARASVIPIPALVGPYLSAGYAIEQGEAGLEAWATLEAGHLTELQGRVGAEDLRLRRQLDRNADDRVLSFGGVSGRLRWRRTANGWRFDVEDVLLWRPGARQAPEGLGLAGHYDGDGVDLVVAADRFPVADLGRMAGFLPFLSSQQVLDLEALNPQGDLSQLRLHFDRSVNGSDWALRARADQLRSDPLGRIPGTAGLSGELLAGPSGAEIQLKSKDLGLKFNTLFRDPLRFDRVDGRVSLERLADGAWRLSAPDLRAENPHLRTRTRMRMDFPANPEASPVLDLQTRFDRGNDAAAALHYFPTGIMKPALVNWLDAGFVSGRVNSGHCIVHGALRDFPFYRTHSGRFEVAFEVEDLVVHYQDHWPELRETAGRVRFLNNSFEANISRGRIFDTRVEDLRVRIDDLAHASPVRIEGRSRGPLGDQLRLLGETPLRDKLGLLAERLRGAGDSLLDLDLRVPLRKTDAYRLSGRVGLRDSAITLPQWDLRLEDLDGDIRFDLKGVQGQGIRGRLFDIPVEFALQTDPDKANATRLTFQGVIEPETLAARIPALADALAPASGAATTTVEIEAPPLEAGPDAPITLRAHSDLQGLALDLPAPLGKTSATRRPMELELRIGADELPVRLRYDEQLDASLVFGSAEGEPTRLRAGDIRVGGERSEMPTKPELQLIGALPKLDLDAWFARPRSGGGETQWPPLGRVALDLQRLRLGGQDYSNLSLRNQPLASAMRWRLSSDQLQGAVDWPQDPEQTPLEARIEHWDLIFDPADDSAASDRTEPPPLSTSDPRALPGMALTLEQLRINEHDFGRLEVAATRVDAGLAVERISLEGEPLTAKGSGHWLATGNGGETRIQLELAAPAVGGLLRKLGFSASVEKAPATADLDLSWPGGPQDWALGRMRGELDFKVGSGNLLEAEPGIGRVFGLLNLGAIQRRLRLDFSDLFNKGLGFESMQGAFRIADGAAVTDGVTIDGPAVKIGIQGRTDLLRKRFDQTATVTANLSSTLPIAGAIAGGPAVGAALFLAQRMIGDNMDALSSTRYRITGPWDEPEVVTVDKAEPPPAPAQRLE